MKLLKSVFGTVKVENYKFECYLGKRRSKSINYSFLIRYWRMEFVFLTDGSPEVSKEAWRASHNITFL